MVLREKGVYRMWYSGSDREKNEYHRIGYAESRDGVVWSRRDEPVLSPHDPSGYYTVPMVLRENGLYKMWYTGHNGMADLRYATSRDGIAWREHSRDPIATRVYCPSILRDGDLYKMWYTAYDPESGPNRAMVIAFATSRDGLAWTPHEENPVMRSTEKWEHRNILYPWVLKRRGRFEMFYTSYGRICELAYATSNDGIRWTKGTAPVLSPDPGSAYDSLYCSKPCLVEEPDGRDKLYYGARVDMIHKYYAIGLAVLNV